MSQFGLHFERYFQIRIVSVVEKTLQRERELHKQFWEYLKRKKFKGHELDVKRKDLQDYAEYQFSRKDIQRNTARNKVYVLKHFYVEAVKQDWIVSSPWSGIQLPKVEHNPIDVMTVKQMKQFLELPNINTIKGVRDRTMFELMYSCALRSSDLLSLTADHFQESNSLLRVKGKADKECVLPVGKVAKHFINFYIEHIHSKINVLKEKKLFLSVATGKALNKNVLYGIMRSYSDQMFPNRPLGTHVFRYSICTHLADEGVDIRYIQEFMRHSKPSTTMRYVSQSYQKLQQVFNETHPRS